MIRSAHAVDVHGSHCCFDNSMVLQFGTYKPDEFLETPAYDRN